MKSLVPEIPTLGPATLLAPMGAPAPAPAPAAKVFGGWTPILPAPGKGGWITPAAKYAWKVGASVEALALALDEACFAKLAEV